MLSSTGCASMFPQQQLHCNDVWQSTVQEVSTKPKSCGYNWATLVLLEIKMGTWPSGLWKSQIWESNICWWVLQNLDPRRTTMVKSNSNRKLQTCPDDRFQTMAWHQGRTGWLIVSCKTTLTLKNGVFWDVMPCGSCKNQHFRGT
jgi:hypothetical protein